MLDRKGGLSSSWRDWLPATLLLAVLLAGATVAQRRTTVAAALLRLFPGTAPPDARAPACNLRYLDGMVEDGDFTWSCGGTACNTTGSGAAQPRLECSRCKLRRFTPVEARECLAGRPLVMIGDSLTRYQFISLIYFLEFGRWPPPLLGAAGDPSPVIQREWGSWADFFQGTTALFKGHQQCRCFREGIDDAQEDRFYRNGNLSVTFYMWTGHPKPLTGLWGFPPFSNATQCRPGACSAAPDWQLPLDSAMREVIARFKPHTLVLNSGMWRSVFQHPDWPVAVYDSIFEAANAAVAPQGGRCIWKSTTYKRDRKVGRDLDASAAAAARRHGWLLMDAWAATQAAKMEQLPSDPYVDTVHFKGFIYAELNQLLLNMVCSADVNATAVRNTTKPARSSLKA